MKLYALAVKIPTIVILGLAQETKKAALPTAMWIQAGVVGLSFCTNVMEVVITKS